LEVAEWVRRGGVGWKSWRGLELRELVENHWRWDKWGACLLGRKQDICCGMLALKLKYINEKDQ
jgi:hypothetical protein